MSTTSKDKINPNSAR